ncbi:MAG: hypothetical protein M1834_005886 [Cirrosporium novae-zelandiae]|nr:MAG: hypothetical protein M1834_005886 [Cirrosporium novae-zelandiae]
MALSSSASTSSPQPQQPQTSFGFTTTGDEVVSAFADRVKGKTILLTGPTPQSLGASTALSLARASPTHLLLLGRSETKTLPLLTTLRTNHPTVQTTFIPMDLSSQTSVRAAVAEIKALVSKIDILINNAAVMACPFQMAEGWGGDGHFLLVGLLERAGLLATNEENGKETTRVVCVSSTGHLVGSGIRYEDWNFGQGKVYEPWEAYGQSKMANLVFARALAKRWRGKKGVAAFSCHPGSIASNLQKHVTPSEIARQRAVYQNLAREAGTEHIWIEGRKTLEQGCATTLVAALDPSLEPYSGAYLKNCRIAAKENVREVGEGEEERLWELSERLVGEKF